ncbi:hypothetical protein HX017_10825 [Myroides marinus]|nr:hypothetical protein [Myroides marinus]MDM1351038.1 hypothetical protein [Myroides marinus]MDM1355294.1 hypothetical protein [Myroides marinus]MDM1358206.1 hypothetical protein [Myroides marinus]MDM1362073.1 hypothetical protein [Myroides marinus]
MPICAYLFFATGVNQFKRLPVITEEVNDLPKGKDFLNKNPSLNGKITVLGFPGAHLFKDKGDAFNLNQKIYNKYREFEDFQLVMVLPYGSEAEAQKVVDELSPISDMSNWNYLFLTPEEIQEFYNSLGLVGKLDSDMATTNVYIIDKDRKLRGRKGSNKVGDYEYKEGYSTISAAELHNDMMDDVKVVLAEYRMALKEYKKINSKKE